MNNSGKITQVINIKDAPRDWKMHNDYVYIGRGSLFGNPFRIEDGQTRRYAIKLYEELFVKKIKTNKPFREAVLDLRGKILVCYCKPLRCHGDVIVAFLRNLQTES